MSYAQTDDVKRDDREAFMQGLQNGRKGALCFEGLPRVRTNLANALCTAGFEQARIERRIGSYPVHLYSGRRHYWLIAPDTFCATFTNQPPVDADGYANLRALWKLKGEQIR